DTTCPLNNFGGQVEMVPDIVLAGSVPTGLVPRNGDTDQNVGIVQIKDTGTSAGSLSLIGSACASYPAGSRQPDLCNVLDVAVYVSTSVPRSETSSTYGIQVFYGSAA